MTDRPPNILLIVADDVSARDLGVYGLKRDAQPTPNLAALAERGALFRNAWMTPACRPSRTTLMTGWYGPRIGYLSNSDRPRPGTVASLGTVAHALKSLGYRTAVTGKWQHDPTPAECGFDEHLIWQRWDGYDGPIEEHRADRRPARYWHPALVENGVGVPTGPDDYGPDLIARWTLEFIGRNPHVPTFVLHNALLVHSEWHFGVGKEVYIATPGEDRARPGSLDANIAYFDDLVGRMVRELDQGDDVPVVIVTSDNGTRGFGKFKLKRQRGPRVMLIVAGDGVAPGRRDQLVDSSDFYPTLSHLAGSKAERDGQSFASVLRDRTHVGRQWIYSWLDEHDFVRTRRWLLDGRGDLHERRPGGQTFKKAKNTATAEDARAFLEKIARNIRTNPLGLV